MRLLSCLQPISLLLEVFAGNLLKGVVLQHSVNDKARDQVDTYTGCTNQYY